MAEYRVGKCYRVTKGDSAGKSGEMVFCVMDESPCGTGQKMMDVLYVDKSDDTVGYKTMYPREQSGLEKAELIELAEFAEYLDPEENEPWLDLLTALHGHKVLAGSQSLGGISAGSSPKGLPSPEAYNRMP